MTEARTDLGVPEHARGLGFRVSSVTLRSPGCLQELRDFRRFGFRDDSLESWLKRGDLDPILGGSTKLLGTM